jgi:protein gp37
VSERSNIEWTDATWNPVRGCSRVSPGCEHCYAERMAIRMAGSGEPYAGLVEKGSNGPRWTRLVRFVSSELTTPLRWRKARRIFVNSMSDLFHEKLTNEQIAAVFGVMAMCPQHTFQVLTKRPVRMRKWFGWVQQSGSVLANVRTCVLLAEDALRRWKDGERAFNRPWPLPNVWLGVSVEDQQRADERIPHLLATPAAVRFVSYEPALGAVYLARYLHGIDWVIAGAESGPGARPMDEEWIRIVRDACALSSTPFFYKQRLDGRKKVSLPLLDGHQHVALPC